MQKTGNLVIDFLAEKTAESVDAAIANPETPQDLKELLWMQKAVINELTQQLDATNRALIKRLNLNDVSV